MTMTMIMIMIMIMLKIKIKIKIKIGITMVIIPKMMAMMIMWYGGKSSDLDGMGWDDRVWIK